MVSVAAPSTSVTPNSRVTNVGLARSRASNCVRPPKKKVVSAVGLPTLLVASTTDAPGTATLLMYGGGIGCVLRRAQKVSSNVFPTRCGLPNVGDAGLPSMRSTLSIGGRQPGRFISGSQKGVRVLRAAGTRNERTYELSVIPSHR